MHTSDVTDMHDAHFFARLLSNLVTCLYKNKEKHFLHYKFYVILTIFYKGIEDFLYSRYLSE